MWNSLCGYVMIRLDGLGLERMLNRMLQAGMPVWNVHREGRARMTAEIRAKDFMQLRALRRGARCRIHILERHGMPFVIARFRFRKLLIAGAILCFAAILAAQTRIWNIHVEGCTRVPEAVIYRALDSAKVQPGMPRSGVETSALGQIVRSFDERIAWAGARVEGVTLCIQVVEAEPIPGRPDKSSPTNVVAQKDGIIERVTALSGKSSVAPGDAVRAGDILIRGDITREGGQQMLVYAEGEVLAQVWYTQSVTLPCKQEKLMRSGQSVPYRSLLIAGLPVYRTSQPFDAYELATSGEEKMTGLILPVQFLSGDCYELTLQQVPAPKEDVLAEALFRAELQALDKVPKESRILKKRSEAVELPDGSIKATVAICTQEQIGVTRSLNSAVLEPQ